MCLCVPGLKEERCRDTFTPFRTRVCQKVNLQGVMVKFLPHEILTSGTPYLFTYLPYLPKILAYGLWSKATIIMYLNTLWNCTMECDICRATMISVGVQFAGTCHNLLEGVRRDNQDLWVRKLSYCLVHLSYTGKINSFSWNRSYWTKMPSLTPPKRR